MPWGKHKLKLQVQKIKLNANSYQSSKHNKQMKSTYNARFFLRGSVQQGIGLKDSSGTSII